MNVIFSSLWMNSLYWLENLYLIFLFNPEAKSWTKEPFLFTSVFNIFCEESWSERIRTLDCGMIELKRLSETILFTFNLLKRKLCVFVPNENLSFLYCFSLEWKFFAENEKMVYGEASASVCTTYLEGGFSKKTHWII